MGLVMKRSVLLIVIVLSSFLSLLKADECNIYSLNLFTPTNRSFKVVVNGSPFFLRIGRDNPGEVGIDRAREIRYLKVGQMLGLTPALFGYELANGLLMTEFIEGSTPSSEHMHDLEFLHKVVTNIHILHSYDLHGLQEAEKTTFDTCRHFYNSMLALGVAYNEEDVSRWLEVISSFEDGYYDGIKKAVCHGDLYHGNLLESLDGKVYLIDWEYSFFGYVIDDLGKLCSDDLSDAEIECIARTYWGADRPDMVFKLKQNVFMHELVHYFWCLVQAHNNPDNAPQYHKRALLMQQNLNKYTIRG